VPPAAAAAPRAAATVDLVERVAAGSRALAADPEDGRTRAGRANDLLDLGEAGLAREDLIALLHVPAARRDDALAALEGGLCARAAGWAGPTHLPLAAGAPLAAAAPAPPPAGGVKAPIPIAPSLLSAGDAGLAKWTAAARALRAGKPDEALRALADAG